MNLTMVGYGIFLLCLSITSVFVHIGVAMGNKDAWAFAVWMGGLTIFMAIQVGRDVGRD